MPDSRQAEIRKRLSRFSWWMRLLLPTRGHAGQREEQENGRFFQDRYKATRLWPLSLVA